MHFGRVENIQGLDFHLPPDPARTEKFLSLPRKHTTQLYVGCPIWSSRAWLGTLYARKTKPSEFLKTYASQFKTVELNSTFYHLLDANRIAEWRGETPPGFRFCPKVFRGITENLASPDLPALLNNYCHSISAFQDRLGLVFAQFSENFGPDRWQDLRRFIKIWPREIPLAVELRHMGWFKNHALLDEAVNFFYLNGVASVITDTPGRRDVLHFSLTQPKVLIRFQGNEKDKTDEERLQEWAERLQKWSEHSLEEIYFFTHQPNDTHIPETAALALKMFSGKEVKFCPPKSQQLGFEEL